MERVNEAVGFFRYYYTHMTFNFLGKTAKNYFTDEDMYISSM